MYETLTNYAYDIFEMSPYLKDILSNDKSSNDYKNKHKAEYLKQLRASYSVAEIKKMLDVLGYELVLKLGDKVITPARYELEDNIKVKYSDLMAMCELLGIEITWAEKVDRTPAKDKV